MREPVFAFAKTKSQISCAVTAQLISAFVFAIRIVLSLFYLNPKFQGSRHLLWLYSPLCVGPGRKSRRLVFSERGSNYIHGWQPVDLAPKRVNGFSVHRHIREPVSYCSRQQNGKQEEERS